MVVSVTSLLWTADGSGGESVSSNEAAAAGQRTDNTTEKQVKALH